MHDMLTIRSYQFGSRKLPGSDDAAPISIGHRTTAR
jgi:hypothetical protein